MEVIKNPRIDKYGFKTEDMDVYKEVFSWCEENFGSPNKRNNRWKFRNHFWTKNQRKLSGYGAVYFSDSIDAMAFKLRWM